MNSRFGILLVSLLFSIGMMAQQPDNKPKPKGKKECKKENVTPEQMAQKKAEMMKTRLQLNATQERKVYDLNLKYGQQKRQLKQQMGELKKQMREMNANQQKELKGILTPEQNSAYEAWKQDFGKGMKKGMKKGGKTGMKPGMRPGMQPHGERGHGPQHPQSAPAGK